MTDAFGGIDVAVAKKKWLPVSVYVWRDNRLEPLPLNGPGAQRPPRGSGNVVACDEACRRTLAQEAVAYLRDIEQAFGARIRTIGNIRGLPS